MTEADRRDDLDLAYDGTFEGARERKLTLGFGATPAQRLAWLESMITLAWASGALPRRRNERGDPET